MKRSGFTLIELMIVIIVIGVLAGMMYLSAGGADDSAKRAECLGEMEKIKTQYAMDEYGTDEDFKTRIAAVMGNVSQATADGAASDTQAKYKGLCASGGEYTITPGENSVKVECSIHGGEGGTVADSGTGSGKHTLYNTNDFISISDSNYWATSDDFNNFYLSNTAQSVSYKTGDILSINGVCYVAFSDVTIDPESTNGFSEYFNEGAFKSISTPSEQTTPVKWEDATTGTYQKGNICSYDGSYYIALYPVTVSKTAGWNTSPEKTPDAWLKINSAE